MGGKFPLFFPLHFFFRMNSDFNDLNILDDFEKILNNERYQIDQQLILKILTKLLFSIFKHISQLPSLLKTQFNNISNQLDNNNSALQNIQNLIQMPNKPNEFSMNFKKHQIFEDNMNQYFQKKFAFIEKKPKDYEKDIFTACIEGKLSSVQWTHKHNSSL